MPGTMMKRPMYKKGSKPKKKKSFPDMSGDGKVTKKDILIKVHRNLKQELD